MSTRLPPMPADGSSRSRAARRRRSFGRSRRLVANSPGTSRQRFTPSWAAAPPRPSESERRGDSPRPN
jgi:hypothetical protein